MTDECGRIRRAKWLDARVGRGLVRALGVLPRPRPEAGAPSGVRSILFIKFWGLGSIVLTEPALRALRARHPGAAVDYLTLERNRELFTMIPGVRRVWTVEMTGSLGFIGQVARMLPALRRQRYDLAVDAEFFANVSALVARAAGARHVTGFGQPRSPKARLLDTVVPFRDGSHAARQFLALAGAECAERPRLRLPPGPGDLPLDLRGGSYLVLNANASALALERRWPRERFAALAGALLERHPHRIVLTGTRDEAPHVAALAAELRCPARVVDASGRLSVKQLAHLLAGAVALVSNDSGPVHLASALGVPVVALYGPESPARYGPLGDRAVAVSRDLWCSPCMSLDNAKTVHCVNGGACMKAIAVEEVARNVALLLAARPERASTPAARRA